jgi:GTPase SAR1 family protein
VFINVFKGSAVDYIVIFYFGFEVMSTSNSTIGKKTYKVVLLGDSSTGKTSIIDRFVNNKFESRDEVPDTKDS